SMSHKAAAFFAILAMMGMMFVLPRDWGIATPLYSLLALGVGGIVWFALIDLKPGERSGPVGDEEPEQKLGRNHASIGYSKWDWITGTAIAFFVVAVWILGLIGVIGPDE